MPASLPSASEPTITCYTKTAWADAWTEQPLLKALSITDQAAPAHSSATLSYRYGKAILPAIGSRAADSTLATITRGSLAGSYVKIVVSGLGTWWGIIVDSTDARAGLLGGTIASGEENYTAFGLTWLLDQTPILKTFCRSASSTIEINRCIPFNGGTDGNNRRDNRVAWKNYDSTNKVFTDRIRTASPAAWKASNAIEYLFARFSPTNAAGSLLIPFALDSSALSFLDYEIGLVEYDGQTVWQIVNRLIDRRRGLGAHAIIDADTVKLVVWSQTASSISLPSGGTIPANPNTMTYDFDNAVNIKGASVSTTLVAKYDQVIVRGERAGSVFSVRPETNVEPDWLPSDQTKYDQGASLKTGYTPLSDADKLAANNDVRASDPLARVYSWWRPKKTWNGRSATDPSTGTAPFAFPAIDADGYDDTATAAVVQLSGLRVQPFIPLRQGVNYSTSPITRETDASDESETEYLPPILLLKAPVIRTSSSDAGWIHCERLNQSVSASSSTRPFDYSVDLSVRDDHPGLILRTVGQPQHYLAKDLFVPVLSGETLSGDAFNSTDWIATVYMLQDQYCRAQWPEAASLPSLDLIRPLSLQVAGAHFDYVVPGTIVAVDAGELQKTALGGFVRDDRQKLRDIARLAYAWHGQTRRILNLSFRGITSGFSVGHLITSIGTGGFAETINTAITSITYDLQGGSTQLHTQFGELDFTL